MSRRSSKSARVAMVVAGLLAANPAFAVKLETLLPELLETHDKVLAAQADYVKSQQDYRGSKSDWYPTLDMTLSQGYEKQLKPASADTKTNRNTEELSLTQLLYDFGETSSKIKSSRLRQLKFQVSLEQARQSITLDAVKAYLNLMRTVEALQYSQRSEANIKRQTGMEEARVRRGSGLSTDVLQTKSSLAGAMATRVRAEGAVVSTSNRYRAVFGRLPRADMLEQVRVPYERIPKSLDEAITIAKRRSLTLRNAKIDLAIAREGVRTAGGKIMPTVEFKASAKHKHNDGGTLGSKEEYLAKVDLKQNLFNGAKDVAGLQSARAAVRASERRLSDTHRQVEESVRNAWQSLSTSRSNAQFLRNQANISGEFLDFARKERKLGTRSLLDVLNGETAYINALSSAVSAETDMSIAAFTLLEAMGELKPSVFKVPTETNTPDEAAAAATVSTAPTAEAATASAIARRISSRYLQPLDDFGQPYQEEAENENKALLEEATAQATNEPTGSAEPAQVAEKETLDLPVLIKSVAANPVEKKLEVEPSQEASADKWWKKLSNRFTSSATDASPTPTKPRFKKGTVETKAASERTNTRLHKKWHKSDAVKEAPAKEAKAEQAPKRNLFKQAKKRWFSKDEVKDTAQQEVKKTVTKPVATQAKKATEKKLEPLASKEAKAEQAPKRNLFKQAKKRWFNKDEVKDTAQQEAKKTVTKPVATQAKKATEKKLEPLASKEAKAEQAPKRNLFKQAKKRWFSKDEVKDTAQQEAKKTVTKPAATQAKKATEKKLEPLASKEAKAEQAPKRNLFKQVKKRWFSKDELKETAKKDAKITEEKLQTAEAEKVAAVKAEPIKRSKRDNHHRPKNKKQVKEKGDDTKKTNWIKTNKEKRKHDKMSRAGSWHKSETLTQNMVSNEDNAS